MARKEITFSDAISPADLKVGDEVAGVYLGTRVIKDMHGEGRDGVIIEMQGPDGDFGLWAPTSLQGVASQLATGRQTWFTYEGKKKNPNTNRQFHSFKVEQDDGVEEAVSSNGKVRK